MSDVNAYRCVRCSSALSMAGANLACVRCASVFPVLGGIPILTQRPDAVLLGAQRSLDGAWSRLQATKAALPATIAQRKWTEGLAQRARRQIEGTEKNLELVRTYMAPVAEYLKSRPDALASALDLVLSRSGGYDAHVVLKYFYQDWTPTPAADEAAGLIRDALARERPDGGRLAVLGPGACGTVHAAAGGFDAVYGIDLSVSTLLIAKGVLAGDAIELHFPESQWQPVRVVGPSRGAERIRLLVADAAALPFDDASLSAVVTQYLLDAVGNPLATAAEISRVLKPGGVWVNISAPITLPGEPDWVDPPTLDELSQSLAPFGFDLHTRSRRHFEMLDLTAIDPGTGKVTEEVFFFVARRQTSDAAAGGATPPVVRSMSADAISWSAVPTLMPGRPVFLARKTLYTHQAQIEGTEIRFRRLVAQVQPELGGLVDALLSQIDGTRTTLEIFSRLTAAHWTITAEEFLELLAHLCWQQGVLGLRAEAPAVGVA